MTNRDGGNVSKTVIAMGEPLLTVQQAADRLQITPRQVYRMMEFGNLDYVQMTAKLRRIPESAITRMLTQNLVAV